MEWARDNRWAAASIAVGAIIALCAALSMVLGGGQTHSRSGSPAVAATVTGPLSSPSRPVHHRTAATKARKAAAAAGATVPGPTALARSDQLSADGHHVVLSVTASDRTPILVYYWAIERGGLHKGSRAYTGARWRVGTTTYGSGKSARIQAETGPAGVPITCRISVDGRTVAHDTTHRPYGTVFCLA